MNELNVNMSSIRLILGGVLVSMREEAACIS
jgi:hypothetical protein